MIVEGEVAASRLAYLCRLSAQCVNTFNSRKTGKHRRGLVKCVDVSWQRKLDGDRQYISVQVRFAYGRPRKLRIGGQGSWEMYRCVDHRKLLKLIRG